MFALRIAYCYVHCYANRHCLTVAVVFSDYFALRDPTTTPM